MALFGGHCWGRLRNAQGKRFVCYPPGAGGDVALPCTVSTEFPLEVPKRSLALVVPVQLRPAGLMKNQS